MEKSSEALCMCYACACLCECFALCVCVLFTFITIQIPQPNKQVRSTDRHIVRSIASRLGFQCDVFHVSVGLRSFAVTVLTCPVESEWVSNHSRQSALRGRREQASLKPSRSTCCHPRKGIVLTSFTLLDRELEDSTPSVTPELHTLRRCAFNITGEVTGLVVPAFALVYDTTRPAVKNVIASCN